MKRITQLFFVIFILITISATSQIADVNFRVDISNETVVPKGVQVAGSFQGWDPFGTLCFGEFNACEFSLYSFDLSVLLEGAFNGIDMNTDLYDQVVLPNNQPYNVSPWNYDGTETITAPPGSDIIDWVLVELRETSGDALTATPDKFLDHQAALLLSDGSIVQPDGSGFLLYTGTITQNLYVIVYHRNHLAVMSASALVDIGGTYTYNFTDALSKAYLDGQKTLGSGMYGMIGGDSDASGTIYITDKYMHWTIDAGDAGYLMSDLNLDTQVNNPDKNDNWVMNFAESSKVPDGFNCGDTFIDDRDGKSYTTVLIGTQCWMAENLNTGLMINGSNSQSNNDIIEKYCYNNDPAICETYGGLYQWDEMMEYISVEGIKGICPLGWHLPTDAEWCTLENEVDAGTISCTATGWRGTDAGANLKDTTLWAFSYTGATNSSGFTALPAGYRTTLGNFLHLTTNTYFWSSSESDWRSWERDLAFYLITVQRINTDKATGFSVRCLQD